LIDFKSTADSMDPTTFLPVGDDRSSAGLLPDVAVVGSTELAQSVDEGVGEEQY
jgi:hypothetical protein